MRYRYPLTILVAAALAASLIPTALAAPDSASAPTFNRDIAPIIYRNCSSCHRPGEAAPFSLLTYGDVAKKGKLIAAVTASDYMPPWKAEPASYAYRDERRLDSGEIELIGAWVKAGMPEGNAHNVPRRRNSAPAGNWERRT
jgi:mono/diheme cytochrome c family protein